MIYRIPTHRHPKPEVSLKHVKVGRLRQFQPLGVRGSQETIWVQSQPLVTSPLLLLVTSMTLRVREKAASVVETQQLLQVCDFNHFFWLPDKIRCSRDFAQSALQTPLQ